MPEALYRKYRPQVFNDVVGQESIERTLKNSIEQNKVSHAYLFTGPRGTGKTTMARLLAKALICQSGPTTQPDNTCEDCALITAGTHPDVYELDAASRTGVENVREEIIGSVNYAPTRGRSKVYIIDEVHMLSTPAFNALLKTLEEPPSNVVFILCTTDPQKVPETIRSRCQCFGFKRIAPEAMVTRLGAICVAENVEFEGEALDLIAQRAEGGLRNALTSLEQIIAYENGKVTLEGAERLLGSIDSSDLSEIMAYVGARDIASCFRWVGDYVETGADLAQFVRDMSEHVRDLYILAVAGDEAVLEANDTARISLANELQWFGPERASRMLGVLGDLSIELKTSSNQRLSFEIALTRMVRPDSDLTLEALAERIEMLEAGTPAQRFVPAVSQGYVAHVNAPEVTGGFVQTSQPAVPAEEPSVKSSVFEASHAAVASQAVQASQVAPSTSQAPTMTPREAAAATAVVEAAEALVEEVMAETIPSTVPQVQPVSPASSKGNAPAEEERAPIQNENAASGGQLANAAVLQRTWQAALSDLKRTQQAHSVLFNGVRASFDAATGDVVLTFPQQSTFAYTAAQKPQIIDTLEAFFKKSTGEDAHFRFTQAQGVAVASQPAQVVAQAQPEPQPEPQPQSQLEAQPQSQPQPESQQPASTMQPTALPATTFAPDTADMQVVEDASQAEPISESMPIFDDEPKLELYEPIAQSATASQQSTPAMQPATDASSSPDEMYEEVPLSAYEDIIVEEAAPAQESAPLTDDASTQATPAGDKLPTREVSDPFGQDEPPASVQPSGNGQAPANSDDAAQLQSLLQFGFGDDITIEEV